MELICKISKGSKMDQVYIPKHRSGFRTGSYVLLRPVETKKATYQPHFYHVSSLEPVKVKMITQIFAIVDNALTSYDNCLVVGSFLEKGFHFHDVDLLLISEENVVDKELLQKKIAETMGLPAHLIVLNNKTLIRGLMTDPLYTMMLSKCVARKRFIYKAKTKINYKLLDLHLLKSKTLIDNFDLLNGNEKYYLVRNVVVILLFLQHKKLSKDTVDREIEKIFALKSVQTITLNMLDKRAFIKTYKQIYQQTFNNIMEGIQRGTQ